jgi:hypothetical protein
VVQIIFALLLSGKLLIAADAVNATNVVTSATPVATNDEKPRFQYTIMLDYSSNLHERGTEKHADESNLWLVPKWNLKNKDSIALVAILQKEFQDEERFDIDTANIVYARDPLVFESFSLPHSARAILALSEELKDRQGLQAGFAIDATPTLNTERLGWLGWTLAARTRLTKNFHEFVIATSGQSNIEYILSERMDVGYAINDQWGIGTTLIYSLSQTYAENRKEAYSWAQFITYSINKNMKIGMGHSNEAGMLKPNGDSNVSLFDENSSTVYGYLELVN